MIGGSTALITLTGHPVTGELSTELAAGSAISIGVTAATGGRTFTGAASLGRDFNTSPVASYFEFERVCF